MNFWTNRDRLTQVFATRGPRAKSGPAGEVLWPAEKAADFKERQSSVGGQRLV